MQQDFRIPLEVHFQGCLIYDGLAVNSAFLAKDKEAFYSVADRATTPSLAHQEHELRIVAVEADLG